MAAVGRMVVQQLQQIVRDAEVLMMQQRRQQQLRAVGKLSHQMLVDILQNCCWSHEMFPHAPGITGVTNKVIQSNLQ